MISFLCLVIFFSLFTFFSCILVLNSRSEAYYVIHPFNCNTSFYDLYFPPYYTSDWVLISSRGACPSNDVKPSSFLSFLKHYEGCLLFRPISNDRKGQQILHRHRHRHHHERHSNVTFDLNNDTNRNNSFYSYNYSFVALSNWSEIDEQNFSRGYDTDLAGGAVKWVVADFLLLLSSVDLLLYTVVIMLAHWLFVKSLLFLVLLLSFIFLCASALMLVLSNFMMGNSYQVHFHLMI